MKQQDTMRRILDRIRRGKPEATPLPDVPMFVYPGDPAEEFVRHLLSFDGRAVKFASRADATAWLARQPQTDMSKCRVYSAADGVDGNVSEADVADAHNAHIVTACVAESTMGVGETGSVWLTDADLRHAACALFARHLFILLDRRRIVGGLHEAYSGLRIDDHQYGSFFTGPSATADIEAVHITGAQGPLSLTVLLYNCADAPSTPELLVSPTADTSVWEKEE